MIGVSVVDDNVGDCSVGFDGFDIVVIASHDLHARVSRREGVWHSAKEHGDIVLRVSRGNRVQDRAADVSCSTGAARKVSVGFTL